MTIALDTAPPVRTPIRRLTGLARLSESRWWAWYLLVPSLVMILAVVLYPTVWGIGLSFREMRLNRPDLGTGFVGLKHYAALINDPVFWISLQNTGIWVFGALVGEFLLGLGVLETYKAWFADPATALASALVVEVWNGFPFFALLLLAGLKAIPADLYEAAACDGARAWRQFVHITLPQLKTIIVASVVLRVITLVNSPDILLILTGGGPGRSTLVLSLYSFLKVSKEFNFGYGSALACVLFVLLMSFSYLYVRLSNTMKE